MNVLVSWWMVLLIIFIIVMIIILFVLMAKEKKMSYDNKLEEKFSKNDKGDKVDVSSVEPLKDGILEKEQINNITEFSPVVEEVIVDLNFEELEEELSKIDNEFDKVVPKKELIDKGIIENLHDVKIDSIDFDDTKDDEFDIEEEIILPNIKI